MSDRLSMGGIKIVWKWHYNFLYIHVIVKFHLFHPSFQLKIYWFDFWENNALHHLGQKFLQISIIDYKDIAYVWNRQKHPFNFYPSFLFLYRFFLCHFYKILPYLIIFYYFLKLFEKQLKIWNYFLFLNYK